MPGLVDFTTPFSADAGLEGSYPVSTISLGYEDIGFRDDGIEAEAFAVVVGDSFASCAGVKMEACWVEILERDTGQDFANLGVITYGPQQIKRMLAKYGLPLRPRLVLWVFFANDPGDAWRFEHFGTVGARDSKLWSSPGRSFLMRNSNTYLVSAFFWHNRRFFYQLATETQEDTPVDANLIWWKAATELSDPDIMESIQLTQNIILEAKGEAELHGAEFVVIMIPTKEQTQRVDADLQAQLDAFNEQFVTFFRQHKIAVADLTVGLRERQSNTSPLYFQHDIHLNPSGNQIVAELVREGLKGVIAQ
jgi:hypothetical protein